MNSQNFTNLQSQIDPCVYIANKFSAFCKQTKHRSGKMEQQLQAIKMA